MMRKVWFIYSFYKGDVNTYTLATASNLGLCRKLLYPAFPRFFTHHVVVLISWGIFIPGG